jgi:primosomal protein N' (replication factor Y)
VETEFFAPNDRIAVLTTQPLDGALDYVAPEGGCFLGAFVEVPLGPRRVMGVVWGAGQGDFNGKLRAVHRVLDIPLMRAELRQFLERAAQYTLTPMPAMLRLATRVPGLGKPPSMRKIYRLGHGAPDRMTDARRRVLEVLQEYNGLSFTLGELAEQAGTSSSVVKGMLPSGAILEQEAPRDLPFAPLDPDYAHRPLSDGQAQAAQALSAAVAAKSYKTVLVQGVTGSGKTEVYLEAIAEAQRQGRQALILLPEIALSGAFLDRVEARFGAKPAEWHSGVTMTERRRVWTMVAAGQAPLVIGARSALFLPFPDLGLIVVDEEHDSSYKQEDGVRYNARDMAVLRASIAQSTTVLVSATPSLETWVNAQAGKYDKLVLNERFGPAIMPKLSVLDMRQEKLTRQEWIAPSTVDMAQERVNKGEQVLFFLNRRGYAPVTMCRACGHQISCHQCDARMVEHRFLKQLMCHQCGETAPIPTVCPSCAAEDRMAVVGPGVERLAEEASLKFPTSRVVTLSSDMFGSARALKAEIATIAEGGADVIVGTQLVAKGHNFPNLTMVGVIDADLGLHGSDMRAAERTFQLMRQVSGRAGRADKPGVCVLQTYQPEHPVIQAIVSGDEERFWHTEAQQREALNMPPFGRLVGLILTGPDADRLFEIGQRLAQNDMALRRIGGQVFGPAAAPIARIKNAYRVRLLVQAPKAAQIQAAIAQWIAPVRLKNTERLSVDIDPQSFY